MAERITRNTFERLRNTDADPSKIQPNQYVEAHNVEVSGEGSYFSLRNIKGTQEVETILSGISDTVEVLGAFRNRYLISGAYKNCITLFTLDDATYKIWCYDTESDTLYELYEEEVEDGVPDPVDPAQIDPLSSWDIDSIPDGGEIWSYLGGNLTVAMSGTGPSNPVSSAFPLVIGATYSFDYTFIVTGTVTGSKAMHFEAYGPSVGNTKVVNVTASGTYSGTWEFVATSEAATIRAYFQNSGTNVNVTLTQFEGGMTVSQPAEDGYMNEHRVIDAVSFPENGTDILYFTDDYYDTRQIKCEIPDPYTANFLTKYDLSVLKRGANGTVALTSVGSGGSLLSGSYQFAYRMADPVNKRFTKWSTLSNPVHVYSASNTSSAVYSTIGLPTDRKITLLVTPSWEETEAFDYLQLAVVENIGPTLSEKASVLEIQAIAGTSLSIDYKSNTRIGTIPLTDITIDLAQIDHVKTLNIKDNRLFAGNITYASLEFDNGDPEITSGSVVRTVSSTDRDGFSSDDFSSKYVGYFRGEVYRFGIVYYDENGNKSPVKHLDLSGVTGNIISSGLTDMKFPFRSTSSSYTLFNGSDKIQSLGLQLNGIINHPSWARGFEIVRVKRKKNILFQTPVVPMVSIYGVGALGNYPSETTVGAGDRVVNDDAQPQTAGRVLAPKNMLRPEQRSILKKPFTGTESGIYWLQGECYYSPTGSTEGYQFSMLFPPESIYTETPYTFTGAEKLDVVDYALLKSNLVDKDQAGKDPAVVSGDDINTNVSANFHALSDSQYYFHSTFSGKSINTAHRNIPIVESETFTTFGQPASVGGNSVMDYDALQTEGVDWGFKPTIQKCAVVKLANYAPDINNIGGTFLAGTLNPYSAGAEIVVGQGVRYESTLSNKLINEYSNYSSSKFVNAISIANVTLGLGDDRYGDTTTTHEYIATGAKYTFSESEVSQLQAGASVSVNVTVYGGDCFVGPHLFKITDSHYSIVGNNANYNGGAIHREIAKFSKVFTVDPAAWTDYVIRMPIALESAAQFIQVVLESEYNGEIREADIVSAVDNVSGIPIYNVDTKEAMRTPLTYKYNINLSQQNDQKIYVPKSAFSFEQNYFGARIAYSEIKIYNSDTVGFDTFKVGNIYDLEEKNGNITKLALSGDDLIAIQEKGILYLPTGSQQIEQANSGTLSVRSGDVIGSPIVIDSERGSQHLKSIVETGGTLYLVDNRNKGIYMIGKGPDGRSKMEIISDMDNDSAFQEMLNTQIPEKNLIAVYDPFRKEYWVVDNLNHKCHVFNEKFGGWVGEYDFTADSKLFAGVATNQKLYLIGKNENLVLAEMYTGDVNQLFGETVTPSVTVVCNPDEPVSKTFDCLLISSSQRLDEVDMVVNRESELGNQTVSGMNIDASPVEGSYRIKVLRDSDNSRLRGLRALITVKFKAIQSSLREIATKYRHSSRVPW
jgi:hypothetical protein